MDTVLVPKTHGTSQDALDQVPVYDDTSILETDLLASSGIVGRHTLEEKGMSSKKHDSFYTIDQNMGTMEIDPHTGGIGHDEKKEYSMYTPSRNSQKNYNETSLTETKNNVPIQQDNSCLTFHKDFPKITQKFIDDMYKYFNDAPKVKQYEETVWLKGGEYKSVQKEASCPPPIMSEYVRSKGISYQYFKKAAKEIPELREAIMDCEEIIKEFIIYHGLNGNYQSQFAIFTAKNLTDMKDKSEVQQTNVDVADILNRFEKT